MNYKCITIYYNCYNLKVFQILISGLVNFAGFPVPLKSFNSLQLIWFEWITTNEQNN